MTLPFTSSSLCRFWKLCVRQELNQMLLHIQQLSRFKAFSLHCIWLIYNQCFQPVQAPWEAKWHRSLTNLTLGADAFCLWLQYCVESKNLKIAFSLFAEMKRYQIQPNLVSGRSEYLWFHSHVLFHCNNKTSWVVH